MRRPYSESRESVETRVFVLARRNRMERHEVTRKTSISWGLFRFPATDQLLRGLAPTPADLSYLKRRSNHSATLTVAIIVCNNSCKNELSIPPPRDVLA